METTSRDLNSDNKLERELAQLRIENIALKASLQSAQDLVAAAPTFSVLEMQRNRQQLEDFFMHAPVPMLILEGPQHLVTLANPLYERFVGREVKGKTVSEAFTKEEAGSFIPLLNSVYQTEPPPI